jgi:hypothetical protein
MAAQQVGSPFYSLRIGRVTSMRQAVVVIRGIGEQRPMDTVCGFVDTFIDSPNNPI